MMWARVRIAVAVMAAVSTGAGAATPQEPSNRPSAPADEFARIDKLIKDAQVKPEDRKMDQIGWAKTIREGMELAKKHGRLFFFFGFDGESIETGRC